VSSGIRINELRLAGSIGSDATYGASFRVESGGGYRPMSIIAGPASTGKTTIIGFIRYCLGDDEYPQHPEVLAAVRSALVELELNGNTTIIERATSGGASKFASVWHKGFADLAHSDESRISTEPPSDPDGLSQFVLAACDLDGIELPEAPSQEDSRTHLLSIRDMFRIMFVPNERLDNRNLVYESGNFMVRQKFLQSVDVMFGVHDNPAAVLGQRLTAAQAAMRAAARTAETIRQFANEDHPRGPLQLAADLTAASQTSAALLAQLTELDTQRRSTHRASADLRNALAQAQANARAARVRLRDRESLLDRLHALRAQYADDRRKLNFLKDAERLFDPLQVVVCPSCLTPLVDPPHIADGTCSLCLSPFPAARDDTDGDSERGGTAILEAELRALTRRMDGLNAYVERLEAHAVALRDESRAADRVADDAAQALDRVLTSPAPWLALRDDLQRRLSDARLAAQEATAGIAVWERVDRADQELARRQAEVTRLTEQRRTAKPRPDRQSVIRKLSQRFGAIMRELDYPKLSNPYMDDNLIPYVRGLPYTAASSGGMVLIGLAWNLALWEVAHEEAAAAPGLLVIDSPQKNLGHSQDEDNDFADASLVENFYNHAKVWLTADGAGAQLIIVDNSPPESVAADVIIRFTRDPAESPYGLITDATN
jgi:hypothetical protein